MSLQINDLFWTVQGEGRWTGHRALFVRLPFCNYNCPWCDTEFDSYTPMSEETFKEFASREPARFAVITGGEPLAHKDLPKILNILKSLGFFIACETNGSFPAPPEIDFVTVSPKPYSKNKNQEKYFIHEQTLPRVSEFKYVVDENFDFTILGRHNPKKKDVIYSLSPEFSRMKKNVETIMGFIEKNPDWKLSLQTHKWIDIP
ncbi:MAG: 7-carboxy-7-deazaguanine synthase QueE [Bdellovibrionales bacterium]|nr:7-carboxy-7-deazaguanine synthase QueE [Bdellovibrionales bacterium]